MSVSRYALADLWNDLDTNYNKFIAENKAAASSQEDENAYELARATIEEMIRLGRTVQAMSNFWEPLAKATLGMEVKNLFLKNFGPEETPPVVGTKSLSFLKDVILPHVECCLKVEFDYIFSCVCAYIGGFDLVKETEHVAQLAENYKRLILASEFLNEIENNVEQETIVEVVVASETTVNEIIGEPFRLFSAVSVVRQPTPVLEAAAAAASVEMTLQGPSP